jgi:hypothetical protein
MYIYILFIYLFTHYYSLKIRSIFNTGILRKIDGILVYIYGKRDNI